MIGPLLHAWNLNLGYAKRLVADIPDDKMAIQPAPGINHAAWVLGHLACLPSRSRVGLKQHGSKPSGVFCPRSATAWCS